MELTAQLPALLAIFMLAAMLVLSTERFAANRKGRDDNRSYQQRMKRNHGEAPALATGPTQDLARSRRDDFWLWSGLVTSIGGSRSSSAIQERLVVVVQTAEAVLELDGSGGPVF